MEGADELIRAIESAANLKLRQSHAPTAAVCSCSAWQQHDGLVRFPAPALI